MPQLKNAPQKRRAGYRLITVDNRQWQWSCGRDMVTAYAMDNGQKLRGWAMHVGNLTPMEMEDDDWAVTPQQVTDWLRKRLDNSEK